MLTSIGQTGWYASEGGSVNQDEMTDQVTAALERGIREMIEVRDVAPFRQAAIEAYRVRTGGKALVEEGLIANHVFPSDVEQSVLLGLQLAESDREKASIILKGALEQVLNRLSVVPEGQWEKPPKRSRWRFWER